MFGFTIVFINDDGLDDEVWLEDIHMANEFLELLSPFANGMIKDNLV